MARVSYRQISLEHINFVAEKLDYLFLMEQDEFMKNILEQLKEYYSIHFLKENQDYLNEVKRLIYTVGLNNQGTQKGKKVYNVYQKLKAGGLSPEDAMDQVGEILMSQDS